MISGNERPICSTLCAPARTNIGTLLSVLLLMLLIPTFAAATESWEKKDWTRWAETECDMILGFSAWARGSGGSVEGAGYALHSGTKVQFYSALPIRLALAREEQFHSKYGKMLKAQKEQFDQKIQTELDEDFSDRVVLHVTSGIYETGRRASARKQDLPGRARITLPSGQQIVSSQPESLRTTTDFSGVRCDVSSINRRAAAPSAR
jgi:hypothetical protein